MVTKTTVNWQWVKNSCHYTGWAKKNRTLYSCPYLCCPYLC